MAYKLLIIVLLSFPLRVLGETVKGDEIFVKNTPKHSMTYDIKPHSVVGSSVYWDDYNRMKGWAWFSLGTGVACGTIGLIGGLQTGLYTPYVKWEAKWQILCGVGAVSTIASVPLFIIAHRKKRKAIFWGAQSVVAPLMNGGISHSPSLVLSLRF